MKRLAPGVIGDMAEVKEIKITEDDAFLILGCDGLWDVMTSAEACKECSAAIDDGADAAERLTSRALAKGSTDNISVIVCHLDWRKARMRPILKTSRSSKIRRGGSKVSISRVPSLMTLMRYALVTAGSICRRTCCCNGPGSAAC